MAVGFTIENFKGVYFLKGMIDESADFSSLQAVDAPLKISLKGIRAINSLGIRNLLTFVESYGKPMMFYHCPLCFVDTVNIIPAVLGTPPDPRRARSFYLPFLCEHCQEPDERLIKFQELGIGEDEVTVPEMLCEKCEAPMVLDGDPDDYFMFILCPS